MGSRVLITGANGFIGRSLCDRLCSQGRPVSAVVRKGGSTPDNAIPVPIKGIDGETDWSDALLDVDVLIHLAARVHVMGDSVPDPLKEYRKVNVQGTLKLAKQAAENGVRRFVFISTIKVNGEGTQPGKPYTAEDKSAPVDPYAISKCEAEQLLRQIASETAMEVVIIRPPLVYGPGVKANFLAMMRFLNKGFPLPLGAINNNRSLVALDNLIDLIVTCIDHPKAANQTFLISDDEDMSTTELLQRMAAALGRKAWLLPVPMALLEWAAALSGKRAFCQRLCGSLQADIGKTKKLLDWKAPMLVDEALQKTAAAFLRQAE